MRRAALKPPTPATICRRTGATMLGEMGGTAGHHRGRVEPRFHPFAVGGDLQSKSLPSAGGSRLQRLADALEGIEAGSRRGVPLARASLTQ